MTTLRATVGALLCAAVTAGCATTVSGRAVRAPASPGSPGAIVALMNTGPYPTAAGHPFGVVGDNRQSQGVLEAERMAEFVVGPWEVDTTLTELGGPFDLGLTGPQATVAMLTDNGVLPAPLPDIAGAHGFIAGFSTARNTAPGAPQERALLNAVLRFHDPAAAGAAAAEMADKMPVPFGAPPGTPAPVPGFPEARAQSYAAAKGPEVYAVTAHGPYVLYQGARSADQFLGTAPALMIQKILGEQLKRIDQFVPTPVDKLADLPLDPTGQLMAHTLWSPDNAGPLMTGAWKPRGWLHFEPDPLAATRLFADTGVDAVAQRVSTVYQAKNAADAARLAGATAKSIAAAQDVTSIDGVTGLAGARCFARTKGTLPPTAPQTWQRLAWSFKCVAWADRWAYTVYSTDGNDVRQQTAAQYRILAGE